MEGNILIVDDDPLLGELLCTKLTGEGFEAAHASDGPAGIAMVRDRKPDLVILDARMPGMDGWETCREIRKISGVPIIFLSCLAEEKDKVRGLDLGADDYMGKPFSGVELVARIRAVLRRSEVNARPSPEAAYVDGEIVIDLAAREAWSSKGMVGLTLTETQILACLIGQQGDVVPRKRLLSAVWGGTDGSWDESLRQHIHHLRQKLEPDPKHPKRIVTRRGEGYQLRRLTPRAPHL